MKLRNVTLVSILILALVVMTFEFFVSNSIVISGFDELEREQVASDARSVKNEFLGEVKHLDTFLWDWSSWDDTYFFAQDGNQAYIDSNLLLLTFTEQSLNAIVIMGNDGEVVYGRAVDGDGKDDSALLQGLLDSIAGVELPHVTDDGGVGGIVILPSGPLLFAKRQILKSSGEGTSLGSMIMARRLGDDMIEEISKDLEVSITVHALKGNVLVTKDVAAILDSFGPETDSIVIPRDDDIIDGFTAVMDIYGDPALLLQVREERRVSRQGRSVALYNYGMMIIALVAFSLLVFFLLQRRVLSRIERLNNQVKDVDMSGKTVAGVTVDGQDEISELGHNVNVMLLKIVESYEDLQEANDELEGKVSERTAQLEEANEGLLGLDKAKSHFLSSTSHELRTPLTSINGFIKLMEKTFKKSFKPHLKDVDGASKKLDNFLDNFKIVRMETERLGRLIDDLLDLNKMEAGRMNWRDDDIDISELVQGAVDTITGQLVENSDVELIVDVAAGTPVLVADRDRVHQVLMNLLNNAAKFTEKGYVKVVVQVADVGVQFSVEDTGGGIPEEDISQIFDTFYQSQAEGEMPDRSFGSGLGLAICKDIVEHYGGRIWVESELGKGSLFKFVLPL